MLLDVPLDPQDLHTSPCLLIHSHRSLTRPYTTDLILKLRNIFRTTFQQLLDALHHTQNFFSVQD